MGIDPSSSASTPQYTTYITTWGPDPLAQVQSMIANGTIRANTMVDIAFGSYNWDTSNPTVIPGLGNLSSSELKQVVALIHQAGGKVSLSFGGGNSAYNYYGSTMYGQPWLTASYINNAVQSYGFDGVDFDVEDAANQMPADFASQQAQVINTLRSLNSSVFISLTLPAQAWGVGDYQQQLVNLTIGNINTFMPMEYDLWVAPSNTYSTQVQSDINYYINTWKVPASKITLGLMPGKDDINRDLTLGDAQQLSQWAKSQGLYGVMTWDADNDAGGVDGNPAFAYSKAIEQALQGSAETTTILGMGSDKGQRKLFRMEETSTPHHKPPPNNWEKI